LGCGFKHMVMLMSSDALREQCKASQAVPYSIYCIRELIMFHKSALSRKHRGLQYRPDKQHPPIFCSPMRLESVPQIFTPRRHMGIRPPRRRQEPIKRIWIPHDLTIIAVSISDSCPAPCSISTRDPQTKPFPPLILVRNLFM